MGGGVVGVREGWLVGGEVDGGEEVGWGRDDLLGWWVEEEGVGCGVGVVGVGKLVGEGRILWRSRLVKRGLVHVKLIRETSGFKS